MKNVLLAATLLLTASAVGQSMTSNKSAQWNAPAFVSNFADCTTGGINCWHDMKTTAAKIFSDNGITYKIDSNCNVSSFSDYPTNTWTARPEYGCVQVLHYINGVLYGLVHSNGSAGYYLSTWNGSTWADISCCFADFSGDQGMSGVFVAHDPSGTIWISKDSGHTFAQHAWCNPYLTSSEAVIGADSNGNPMVVVACQNGTIWQFNGTNWGQLPGSATQIVADENGTMYMLSGGHANHWSSSAAWEALNGNVTFIADGGPMNVWAINGSEVYRFGEIGIQWSRSFNGSVNCNVPPPFNQQICPTFHHTAVAQLKTGTKNGYAVNAAPWNNSGSWSLTATVNTNDTFDCFDHINGDCLVRTNDDAMSCSAGASVLDVSDPQWGVDMGVAINVQRWTQFAGEEGPTDHGRPPTGFPGFWEGRVASDITLACPAGTMPTCGVAPPLGSEMTCPYDDVFSKYDCYEKTLTMMSRYAVGQPSPWVFFIPWIIGSSGHQSCAPGSLPGYAAWGQWWKVPPCQ